MAHLGLSLWCLKHSSMHSPRRKSQTCRARRHLPVSYLFLVSVLSGLFLYYRFLDDKKEVQTLLLGEHDDIYVKYRHLHITLVIRGVAEELRKFSQENAAAQYAAAGGKVITNSDSTNLCMWGSIQVYLIHYAESVRERYRIGNTVPPPVQGDAI